MSLAQEIEIIDKLHAAWVILLAVTGEYRNLWFDTSRKGEETERIMERK